ncbi:sulfotransferase family cytosolic 1B member 1-like [Lingula anatina]|uniref:Sulfotransferase family cytosolic 1B member 1-like n=1 Tax=Lingula anatina TaxID=7574 RepID=A0A2R2MSH4_LINAN|nr:sulfotransferase family cytosolic 1B member 1-like [Lingula anatina]|eukprot:XP_023933215.1 sulfotransferase family cytosolic 1B member 1-like [Lingula anatina]
MCHAELTSTGAYGSWFDKELDWWTHERQNPNVLFMSYEERIKAPEESVRKVIRFLDLENLPMDDNFLQNVVKRTSFESMKNEDGQTLTKGLAMQTGTFCRKGQVGDWKNYFTVKQNEDFDKKFFEKMKETDLAVMF